MQSDGDCLRQLFLLCGSLIFVHGVPLLRMPIKNFPMLEWNDILDLFGIFLLVISYWMLLLSSIKTTISKLVNESSKPNNKNPSNSPTLVENIVRHLCNSLIPFLFAVILLSLGWGSHNAANANGHLFTFTENQALEEWELMEEQNAIFIQQTIPSQFSISNFTFPLYSVPKLCNWTLIKSYYLTYFYDEQLGHILTHLGWCMLDSLILKSYWRTDIIFKSKKKNNQMLQTFFFVLFLGFLAGCFFFARHIEGQTAKWIGIPWSLVICIISFNKFLSNPVHILKQPIVTFFFVQYITGLWLILSWALYFGSFIEFSSLGWL